MKYEWRKQEKDIYTNSKKPMLISIPKTKYICIKGNGNPNDNEFKDRIGVLYSVSYAIKMMPKNGYTPNNYYEYTVYPLEGLWDLTDKGRNSNLLLKDELLYTIMIKQPDFVTKDIFLKALEITKRKKSNQLLDEIYFDVITDGLSVQMMHIGSYDDEPKTFNVMKDFIKENNLRIKTLVHREIYISDARKVEKDKLKTILRYRVEK